MTTTNGEPKAEKNALANEQRPSTADGTTPSAPEVKMVPETEIAKRHSKLMKTIDTLTKERDTTKQNLDSLTKEVNELRRLQDEKEEAEASSKPDGLKELQKKRDLAKKEQEANAKVEEANRRLAEVDEELREGREAKQEITIWQIASENNVDPVILKERCAKYKLATKEDIEDYAKEHTASLTKQEKQDTPKVHVNTRENGGSETKIGDMPPKERYKVADKQLRTK